VEYNGPNTIDADSRPVEEEKYIPLPTRKVLTNTVSRTTRMGRKNGRPRTSIPSAMGTSATDAAASGTVGTRRILAGGNWWSRGRDCAMDDSVVLVVEEMESTMWNHDCARECMAPISVRYGPERHNLRRSVGWFSVVDVDDVSCALDEDVLFVASNSLSPFSFP